MSDSATWHVQPCDECGQDAEYSRSTPRVLGEPHTCTDCEMYSRGYEDGIASLTERLHAAEALANIALECSPDPVGSAHDPDGICEWVAGSCIFCAAPGPECEGDAYEHNPDCKWIMARRLWQKAKDK